MRDPSLCGEEAVELVTENPELNCRTVQYTAPRLNIIFHPKKRETGSMGLLCMIEGPAIVIENGIMDA